MPLSIYEQYEIADRIIAACCSVGEITYPEFISRKKNLRTSTLRGVFFLLARDMKVHPVHISRLCHRTRSDVINVHKKYIGYLRAKDKLTTEMYNQVKDKLQR